MRLFRRTSTSRRRPLDFDAFPNHLASVNEERYWARKQGLSQSALMALVAFALLAGLSSSLPAQAVPDSLQIPPASGLLRLLRSRLLELQATTSVGIELQSLVPPIAVPSRFGSAVGIPSEVLQFERRPSADGPIYRAVAETISGQLIKLSEGIELSDPELSNAQVEDLNAARALLYLAGTKSEPSAKYNTYLEYKEKERDLVGRIAASSNGAVATNLRLELREVRRNWEVLGSKTEIERALNAIRLFGEDDAKSLLESWRGLLANSISGDYSGYIREIASLADWTVLSFSVKPEDLRGSKLVTAAGAEDLAEITHIAMRLKVVPIRRPALAHPFLRSANWRNKESYVLSDGLDATGPAELLPRAATAVVLVKGLEFTFGSVNVWGKVAGSLKAGETLDLGGIPIDKNSAFFASPQYLALAAPYVVAAYVAKLPKTPDPSPTDSWPWW